MNVLYCMNCVFFSSLFSSPRHYSEILLLLVIVLFSSIFTSRSYLDHVHSKVDPVLFWKLAIFMNKFKKFLPLHSKLIEFFHFNYRNQTIIQIFYPIPIDSLCQKTSKLLLFPVFSSSFIFYSHSTWFKQMAIFYFHFHFQIHVPHISLFFKVSAIRQNLQSTQTKKQFE